MISPFQRRAFISLAACFMLAAFIAPTGARAAEDDTPIDAMPLIRPGAPMRGLAPSDEPLAPPPSETAPIGASQTEAPPQPAILPGALPAPEAALVRVRFQPDDATLDAAAIKAIDIFAAGFKTAGGRIGLKAYAGKPGDMGSNARRLSLKRVLAVREVLLAQGISAQRLEVHALGGTRDAGPPDRVDIVKSGR